MDVYIDLSLVLLSIQIMVCLKGCELLLGYRYKRGMKFTLILANLMLFFTLYLHFWTCLIGFVLANLILHRVFYPKFLIKALIFFALFFLIDFFLILVGRNVRLLHIYLIVEKPLGVVYALLVPLFGVMLAVATRLVDSLFRLHVFKTTCIITKDEKKYAFQAYFDTGNTLKYDNVPVVFCLKSLWNFSLEQPCEIEVTSVNGTQTCQGYGALINLEGSEEDYYVYVVLVDTVNSFHGCEVLLNAYLR